MPLRGPSKDQSSDYACKTCFDLDLRYIHRDHRDPNIRSLEGIPYRFVASTELAKNTSCSSCRFLKSAFDTLVNSGDVVDVARARGREITYSIAILNRTNSNTDGENGSSVDIVLRCNGIREDLKVEIYTPPNGERAPWNVIGEAGEVPTKPSAEECAGIIKPWLIECDRYHTLCQTHRSIDRHGELLPKRVLDLSGGHIRLTETIQGQRGQYIALSHCWGPKQLLTTTRDTIAERMGGIPMEQLPQTFQDVVAITRCLGLQYIWIDSLCIIQKDLADWEQQSAVMANIYECCYLNIATTRAGGGHEGCLGDRWNLRGQTDEGWWEQTDEGKWVQTDEGGKWRWIKCDIKSYKVPGMDMDIRIRLALQSAHGIFQSPEYIPVHSREMAPLLHRGWVYQERFLSSRTVHLHANEMVWACNIKEQCECKGFGQAKMLDYDYSVPGATKDQILKLDGMNFKEIYSLWRAMIQDACYLDLTYESDRLTSLSGLASRVAKYLPQNERYLAGLWEGDLVRNLLWQSVERKNNLVTTDKKLTAPSWSWASLAWGSSQSISWEHETIPKHLKLGVWSGAKTYTQDPRTRIISASVNIPL